MSIGQIWLVNGPAQEINTLEAGWRVSIFTKIKHQLIFRFYFLSVRSKL